MMTRIALLLSCGLLVACSRGPTPPPAAPAAATSPPSAAPASAPPPPAAAVAPAVPEPVAPASAPPADATAPDALARWDGYGDLRFGMAPEAARQAWGGELAGDAADRLAQCGYLHPAWSRPGKALNFMFEGGRLVRYDVDGPAEAAPGGGRLGMARAQIEALYAGRVEARPHHYVKGAWYLRVRDPEARDRALVFETDAQGRVTRWRIGLAPTVDYIEGCA